MRLTRIKQVSAVVLSTMLLSCGLVEGLDLIGINKCEAIVRKVIVRKPVVRKPSHTTNNQENTQSNSSVTTNNIQSSSIEANRNNNINSVSDYRVYQNNKKASVVTENNNKNNSIVLGNATESNGNNAYLKGDINGDGKVSLTDLSIMKAYMVGNLSNDAIFIEKNADINGDGKISITDMSLLKEMIMNPDDNRNIPDVKPIVDPVTRYKQLTDGWYSITSVNAPSKGLDVYQGNTFNGSNIILYEYAEQDNQKFYLKNQGDGTFTLKAGNCDLYLDAANGSSNNNTNVQLYQGNGTNAQKWKLVEAGNNQYYIESALRTKLSFDCANGGNANGTNIQLWDRGNVAWNKWIFTSVKEPIRIVWPLDNPGFDYRQWGKQREDGRYHVALDLYSNDYDKNTFSQTLTLIKSIANGIVEYSGDKYQNGTKSANGNSIVIKHFLNGRTFYSFYAHLSARNVQKGAVVRAGDVIGHLGKTGNANDIYHLHFSIIDTFKYGSYRGYIPVKPNSTIGRYENITFYNPRYVLDYKRLPD